MPLPPIEKLETLSDAELSAFRATCARQGFAEATIDATDGMFAAAPADVRLPIVRSELRQHPEPAFRIALLLSLNGELPRDEVEALLGAGLTRALLGAGFLVATPRGLGCPFRVIPEHDLLILSDATLGDRDSVMPPGPTTTVLGRVMPAAVRGSMIDVGCGPGSLALLAAKRGATRVLGTDINPRAIVMARFNARWNGLAAEFRAGDLFEPAAGERFDLLISQPPFVAQPPELTEVTFLYGGPLGDEIPLRLMKSVARALTPDGEALVLSDVPLRAGEDLGKYLRESIAAEDLHVLALHLAGPSPDAHAVLYAPERLNDPSANRVREVQQHRQHMQSLGIESFRHALFILRRPAPARREVWRSELAVRNLFLATSEIRTRLWHGLRSAGESDAALLGRCLRVAPDATWMSLRRAPEGEQFEHRVRFGDGWPALEQIVTDEGLALASLLERSPSVEAAIAGYAELCESTPAEVCAPLLEYIRRSLLSGMLVPEVNGDGR